MFFPFFIGVENTHSEEATLGGAGSCGCALEVALELGGVHLGVILQ